MISEYHAAVIWERAGQDFLAQSYSRRHRVRFDGGAEWLGSSSPLSVPVPMSDASAVDPEEMLVAAVASCHMLWFLALAAKRKHVVEGYADDAVGQMEKDADGKFWIARVLLRPRVMFAADSTPTQSQHSELHARAHEQCFIAHSIKGEVLCEPVFDPLS